MISIVYPLTQHQLFCLPSHTYAFFHHLLGFGVGRAFLYVLNSPRGWGNIFLNYISRKKTILNIIIYFQKKDISLCIKHYFKTNKMDFNRIRMLVDNAETSAKLLQQGRKSSAKDLRKNMMDIKRIAGDSRKEALVVLKAIPVKKRAAKAPEPPAPVEEAPAHVELVEESPAAPKSRAGRVRVPKTK